MRILISGSAGFIGSHLMDACAGHKVMGIDLRNGVDVSNPMQVTRLFAHNHFDLIIHCAAYAAEGLSHHIRHYNYTHNLLGSINLINAAVNHHVKRFIFLSSVAVYGENHNSLYETTQPTPSDPYGIAKYAVELDLQAAARTFGLEYTIWRMHNVYGERQNASDLYRNVVGIFMREALTGKPFTVFGDGEQRRAFTYISDVVQPILALLDERGCNQVFNVGADKLYSINELAAQVADVMGVQCRIEHLPARVEAHTPLSMHDKLRGLGIQALVSLDDGLARMGDWMRTQAPSMPVPFESIEIVRGMPESWQMAHA